MPRLRPARPPETLTLAELRERHRVSQAALASHMGKSQPAVHSVERSADPQYETLRAFVQALGEVVREPADLDVRATLGKQEYRIIPAPRPEATTATTSQPNPQTTEVDDADGEPHQSQDQRRVAKVQRDAPEVVAAARRAVEDLIRKTEAAGRKQIMIDHLEPLARYFDLWAQHFGRTTHSGVRFGGQSGEPGLWHALDGLHPLDPPDRWDQLRKATIDRLLQAGEWERVGPSIRGSEFLIRDDDTR